VARAASGLRAVRSNSRLAAAAGACANDMVARGYFDHVSPDGSTPRMRVRATGYRGRTGRLPLGRDDRLGLGRDVDARGDRVRVAALPEHRAILLSPLYREVGIGLAIGAPGTGEVGATVAADFGTRR
jgi:uncharacterized protein YkwD